MPPLRIARILLLLFATGFAARSDAVEVYISEFMASNGSTLADDFGDYSDWIELTNAGTEAVDLAGWRLSDNASNNAKWVFPSRLLPPGGVLLVWASDRNRKLDGSALHTNFKLSTGGEYLGLFRPDGTLADAYSPAFPAQVEDVSYGRPSSAAVTLLAQGAAGQVGVPSSAGNYTDHFAGWTSSLVPLSNASWTDAQTGVGFDSPGASYGTLISPTGNLSSRMSGLQRTACLRLPFVLPTGATIASMTLRMKYDDGFIAWINGAQVASDAAPASPVWNSLATLNRNEDLNSGWTSFSIPLGSVTLNPGDNLLAIQGFNVTVASSDFLLLPELDVVYSGSATIPPAYFPSPTPGAANGTAGQVGPLLTGPVTSIPRPTGAGSPAAAMSVRVTSTSSPVAPATVKLAWRVMFDAETAVTLLDNGAAPDAAAGDGIYSAWMPTSGPAAGQMIRWRYEAADTSGRITRAPPYLDPADADYYYGSVAVNSDEAASQLPVLHWFIPPGNIAAAGTLAGTRAAFFFLDRFYDNVAINLHGQSTSSFSKKSHDLDFNDGNRFAWNADAPLKVKDINLLTNYADKARVRNTLAHDTARLAGAVHHFAFPVRVQQNAAFHGVWDMVEDGDDRMLERNGLDPGGALYKMYNTLDSSTSNVEKKTRKEETANADLAALVAGLNPSTALAARRTYAYDHVNLPATINYLVTRQLNSDRDHGHKNYYLYRDTNRTREWEPLVWDVDLSWGHNWNASSGYFDNTLVYDNPLDAGATDNRLYALVYESPELRAMFLRRMRTLMDTVLQPPGTANGGRETFARTLVATIDPDPANPSPATDGDRDYAKWGSWGSPQLRPREELERVITGYLAPRRAFLFNTSAGTRPTLGGDPLPDTPQNVGPGGVVIESLDFLPASGRQAEEYVILRNTTAAAVDLTGWRLEGAIDHPFAPGTVIPAGAGTPATDYLGLLHVARDAFAFRARATGPTGGQRRLVQGNYSGQLSARGETLVLRDGAGTLIHSFTYAGAPTAHQTGLRIVELGYAPLPPTAAEAAAIPGVAAGDFEFIELLNIGATPLDLAGLTFSQGLTFTFPSGIIGPGGRLVLAKSPPAFALRHPGVTVPVYGPYDGQLNNAGERVEFSDPAGENILDFEFKDGWYPATSGASGHSLVARNPASTAHDDYGNAVSWAISQNAGGSPGAGEAAFAQAYLGWDNDHFTQAERDNPLSSGTGADPDGDGRSNLAEYVFGSNPRQPDTPPASEFAWGTVAGQRRPGVRFLRAARALDLTYTLIASADPSAPPETWTPVASQAQSAEPAGTFTEHALMLDAEDDPPVPRYYRIRVTYAP